MLQVNGTFDWGKLGFPCGWDVWGGSTPSLSAAAVAESHSAALECLSPPRPHFTVMAAGRTYAVKTDVVVQTERCRTQLGLKLVHTALFLTDEVIIAC